MIFTNFLAFFSFFPQLFPSWIRILIRLLNADPGGKRNVDPDPQSCWYCYKSKHFLKDVINLIKYGVC